MEPAGWKRVAFVALLLAYGACLQARGAADNPKPGEPADAKARKTFAEALEWQHQGHKASAVDTFRKANKQDGGHCIACLERAYTLAMEIGSFKDAASVARDWETAVDGGESKAAVHFRLAMALQQEGISEKKEACLNDSCAEFKATLELDPKLAGAHYGMGISLARLHQDDAARAEFAAFLREDRNSPDAHERAKRYEERVELARARMAPPFAVTTLDGQKVSLDSLAGKVVLIDFWATWCGPCRQALPHIREIAQRFAGQPLVVLSVSLDQDEGAWKQFVAKNEMAWPQYRDGRFTGPIATRFGVTAIPATFTIDADGVLEDQHVGDADIEGKIKKLVARAAQMDNQKSAGTMAVQSQGVGK
jgi:thiol-disulfide isomerase/thioredoxin